MGNCRRIWLSIAFLTILTMIKINDERRLLNLSHTVIYLMLTPEEHQAYAEKLRTLNNDSTLTKGLFSFDIVEKGDAPYEQLPVEMIRATRECNVFVRLINSIHGIFCYGLELVDIDADFSVLKAQLMDFVESTCKENIMNLDILAPRGSALSIQAMNYYYTHQLFSEVFESALNLDFDDMIEAQQTIENITNSYDATTSHDLMRGVVDNRLSEKVEKERLENETPKVRPEIIVEIKTNVDTGRTRKNGEPIKELGIEITINGTTPIPVCFTSMGGSHLTYLYLMLLIGNKEGINLRRKDFTELGDRKIQRWLRNWFGIFLFDTTFDKFLEKVNAHGTAALVNDAKSKINKALWTILSDEHKDAYHYLCVFTKDKRKPSSKYEVRLGYNQIKIDPNLCKRISVDRTCLKGVVVNNDFDSDVERNVDDANGDEVETC